MGTHGLVDRGDRCRILILAPIVILGAYNFLVPMIIPGIGGSFLAPIREPHAAGRKRPSQFVDRYVGNVHVY